MRRFLASEQARPGVVGSGRHEGIKSSADIVLDGEWDDVCAGLLEAVIEGILRYIHHVPHMLAGALAVDMGEGLISEEHVASMPRPGLARLLKRLYRPGEITLQRYRADQGGYFRWHSEVYPKHGSLDPLHRVLFWIVYLNDVEQGGETEFFYQRRSIHPEAGTLLIAPAGFTHTHRGNAPIGTDKYIATSWILFQPAHLLFEQR